MPFTAKEVRKAVFQMGPLKSPGPDGIPAIFYQKCWHLVKKDFTKAVLSTLNSGVVLRKANRTFITLVPKCDNPEEVQDYRPISLCNLFMRVVTKCIPNHLLKLMGLLVGPYQNAFLSGRNISDNILLAHEVIHKINSHKKGKHGNFPFKADMSKAYDRIKWDFLKADRRRSFGHLKRILNDYCAASGHLPNEGKSGIIFSPNTKLRKVRFCLKVQNIRNNKGIGKYMGMSTEFQTSKNDVFKGLIDNVTKRISSWNGIFLSPAGRLTLISSVLSNLFTFYRFSKYRSEKSLHWRGRIFTSLLKSKWDLGIWNIECLNQAFLAKHAWRLGNMPNPKDEWLDTDFSFLKDMWVKDFYYNERGWNEELIKLVCDEKVLPQSWKILVWKIVTDSLPVGYEFERRKLDWDSSCPTCKGEQSGVETMEHLFRDCDISSRIWAGSSLGINSANGTNIRVGEWIINWIHYMTTIEDNDTRIIQFLAILVSIWTMRNNYIFRGENFIPALFFKKYSQLVVLTLRRYRGDIDFPKKGQLSQGNYDEENEIDMMRNGKPFYVIGGIGTCQATRICVDANWENYFAAAFGWVAYNYMGEAWFEGATKSRAELPLQAGAMGIKVALEWAYSRGIVHLKISSDCPQLLTQWAGKDCKHHQVRGIVEDINNLTSVFHCLCFSYVRRNLNGRAHDLAKRALRSL
ncbi:uncharacterized protein LOC141613777 [Silene latifolia]|uniref:uncharacterized protein LOC141613777 n=1 Tax=Silene latifolia TaxID=37657 RepID=UPI003D773398